MAGAVAEQPERVSLFGVRVDRVTMERTLELIDRLIRMRSPAHVVTLDASMCVIARDDPELRRIVLDAEIVTPDSVGILWACRRLGMPLPQRVSGVEIVDRLCATSAQADRRIFFLGAAPGVAEAAAEQMREQYPGCMIVGTHHGYFQPSEEPQVLESIRDVKPDVL